MQKEFSVKIALCLSPEKSNFSPLLFAGDLYKGINVAADLGYDGVEISIRDSKVLNQEKLIKAIDSLNLKVYSIATGQSFFTDGYSFSSEDKDKRLNAIKRMKGHIDFAQVINCSLIVGGILGNVKVKFGTCTDIERRITECFIQCLQYAKEKKVMILFEPINFYLTYFVCTLDEGANFIKSLGYNNMELMPDTHHMHMEEKSINESLAKYKDLFHYIHFSDSNRQAPGFGNIDYQSVINTLRQQKFNGIISFEILPLPEDMIAAQQAIKYVKSLINKN
jgi:sugar phosphate isomerase/epimerase